AKAVASLWKLPLLRFDVGAVFAKFVGESEANMRRVIKVAESLSPCILWIDELDKAFSFRQVGDAGTTARVLATLLTWLQEKTKPVFVIATANSISELPPELLRKGRFDEIFFVDLPNREERKEIFAIHLRKRNRSITAFDLEALADTSEGFSGAEIEQAIIDALYDAYDEDRELTTQDILRALESTVPLSRTMSESIEELRDWAATRARPASRRADVEAKEAEVSEAELTASVAQREQPVDAISYWERGPELD
ncbi:MAG TPA: AAA family ATPase, partial [Armatimonadetes bacterium]|nr:AAA family ATPase [Armatimonadota bacterium]